MPPVLGPWSPSLQALVVLAGGERQHVRAVAHDDEAGFLALEKFLDHDARAGVAFLGLIFPQHCVDRGMRFLKRHCHHHAFAGGQAVGLDHDRRALLVDIA